MNIVSALIVEPVIIIVIDQTVKFVDLVMSIDIAQFKALPQSVDRRRKIFFVIRIEISGVQVKHQAIFRIGFQTVPGHRHTVTGTIGLIDKVALSIGISIGVIDNVRFHGRRNRQRIHRCPGDDRAQISHVFLLRHFTTMIAAILIKRGTIFQQGI